MNEKKHYGKRHGAIAWMAGNPVASNIFLAILIIGGLMIGKHVKQEVFPEFDMGIVRVSVSYPGASPEEVERGIVLVIEEALNDVEGINEIRSRASEGNAGIDVEAMESADIGRLAREIESEVDSISFFPEEAEEPRVSIASRRREVISYAIYGNQNETVLRERAEQLRDELLSDPSITQVGLEGIRDFEIQIEVATDDLRRYGLTINDIADKIKNSAVDLPGGSLKTAGGEILVRMKERRELALEYAELPLLTYSDGSRTLLRDIADIKEGFADSNRSASFNGMPAILVEVYRVGSQKPLEIAGAVKKKMAQYRETLPEGIDVAMVRDMSELFRQRAELLKKNAFIGLILVFLLLAVFLEIRLAFWVSVGIPASILGSFLFLPMAGFSINIVSMFAFIVTLGIVVDDAIIVGENVFYNRQRGMSYIDAAIYGAKEIAMPVTFSILTNIVAFIPLFFVPGFMGKIFRMIPVVVITVLSISLLESLFVLPSHLGHQKKMVPKGVFGWISSYQKQFSKAFASFVENRYGPVIETALKYRYSVLATGIAIFFITAGYVKSGRMGFEQFPRVESNYAYVTVTLPYGTSRSQVEEVQAKVARAAKNVIGKNGGEKLSRGILTKIKENVITARLLLTPPKVRPISTPEVARAWRKDLGILPGIESIIFQSDRGGPGSGRGLTIELSHRDTEILTRASEELASEIATFPNASDIDDGSARGKLQYDFRMLPVGERLGFSAGSVARQIRNAFYGAEVHRIQRGRNEVKVVVRLPEEERISEYTLEDMIIISPSGNEALLSEVVDSRAGRAYTSIARREGKRISQVTANITPRSETNLILDALKTDFIPTLLEKYPGLSYSLQGKQAAIKESISSLITGLLMSLLVIYCLLAIPLKSYFQPLLIMSCIPFGLVGTVIGHLLLDYSLSVMSLFGLVALSGVVVNDSLVLIDFANRKRGGGLTPVSAVHAAAIHRFRPILLTTLTTFGGLSPMIFETSRQAKFLIPMAISLGFGILFATLITLLLVPVLYMILEDVIAWVDKFSLFDHEVHEPLD